MNSPGAPVTTVPLSNYPITPSLPRFLNLIQAFVAGILLALGVAGTIYLATTRPGNAISWQSSVLGLGAAVLIVSVPTYRFLFARRAIRLGGKRGWIFSRAVRSLNGDLLWRQGVGYFTLGETLRIHLSSRIEEIPWADFIFASRLEGIPGGIVRPLLEIYLSDGSVVAMEIVHGNPRDALSNSKGLIDRVVNTLNGIKGNQTVGQFDQPPR